ncbi:MAG: bifunctional demethylmenaquinone methyltransferase/2-methoxy-6-polyprenyl-1,4-benzoquinol methylase UbiE [Phycisphaeraceae bacterium]|nr:MAG: bifunctional demethylmenaquinone methyltransferase/2-methoxy-6-polyprenyl-1,4-benzoquinol methylase UbiE [Phycisphaeraceae bacterium]
MTSATEDRTNPAPPVWHEAELANPHASEEKASKVRSMFAAIARSYDLNNRVHSLWFDQAWRRHAVRSAGVRPGETVLDVACGTGDLTEAFAARSPASEVIGVDFTPEMLEIARTKQAARKPGVAGKIRYQQGDAMALDFPDASVDVVSIAFGIRNVQDPAKAIGEFARILRPGGRLVILEFDTPRAAPVRWFNAWYCGWLMPRTATLLAGDRSGAYRYLPKSVGSFMPRERMLETIRSCGFDNASVRSLSLGLCACYRAERA